MSCYYVVLVQAAEGKGRAAAAEGAGHGPVGALVGLLDDII